MELWQKSLFEYQASNVVSINGPVALRQTDKMSWEYAASHPVMSEINSIPPPTLKWLRIRTRMGRWTD